MLVTCGFVRPLARYLHNVIVAAIGVAAAVMRQLFCPVSHKLNMISFVQLSVRPTTVVLIMHIETNHIS